MKFLGKSFVFIGDVFKKCERQCIWRSKTISKTFHVGKTHFLSAHSDLSHEPVISLIIHRASMNHRCKGTL